MFKTEKVVIELTGHQTNPPVKICKAKNKQPVSNKFRFIPKYMPTLEETVTCVHWDCATKTLNVVMKENATFDTYNWFSTINKRLSEAQRSSFVDLEQDSLTLVLQDQDGNDVSSIKFRGLELTKHSCRFLNSENAEHIVTHHIDLEYTDCETIQQPSYERIGTELVDDEWQTVEV